jgi:glycine cleavage system regulatory protein
MGIAQYLDQKEVTVGQSKINVFEMAAADRVAVVDTINQFFELPKEEFTKGHELTITALVIQRSVRNSDGELIFNENQVGEIPKQFSRKAMQQLFDTACELSELEFLQGKSQTESPSETSQTE